MKSFLDCMSKQEAAVKEAGGAVEEIKQAFKVFAGSDSICTREHVKAFYAKLEPPQPVSDEQVLHRCRSIRVRCTVAPSDERAVVELHWLAPAAVLASSRSPLMPSDLDPDLFCWRLAVCSVGGRWRTG